jgi:hypothetical protein
LVAKVDIVERFWSHVDVKGDDECWNWTASLFRHGYGQIKQRFGSGNGKNWQAHRLSYVIHFGEIADNLLVCHKCDNPKCVNPNHLFLGTNKENTMDMVAKGRAYRPVGVDVHNSKLSEDDVRFIRSSHDRNFKLAERFKVSQATICIIRKRLIWKHIE